MDDLVLTTFENNDNNVAHHHFRASKSQIACSFPCEEAIIQSSSGQQMSKKQRLFVSGSNGSGQLGLGDYDDRWSFTEVPATASFSQKTGSGEGSSCGELVHAQGGGHESWQLHQLAFGGSHTLASCSAIRSDTTYITAQVFRTGNNDRGQLGPSLRKNLSMFTPLELQDLVRVLPSRDRTRLENEGVPYTYARGGVAATWETSFVCITPTREVEHHCDYIIAFGGNDWGEFGGAENDTEEREGGGNVRLVPLWNAALRLPSGYGFRIRSVHSGVRHVVAIVEFLDPALESTVCLGWGASRHGHLSNSSPKEPLARHPRTTPVSVLDYEDVSSISLGRDHTVIARKTAQSSFVLECRGSNRRSQLSLNGHVFPFDSIVSCTWSGTYVLTPVTSGEPVTLVACGSNSHGQLGTHQEKHETSTTTTNIALPGPGTATNLFCGSEHVLIQLDLDPDPGCAQDGGDRRSEVWGWGWNEHGNLGTGTNDDSVAPMIKIWPPPRTSSSTTDTGDTTLDFDVRDAKVVKIWAGNATSWILIED